MRGFIPAYEVKSPGTLAETLQLLHDAPGTWKPLAGATDVMVLLDADLLKHRRFVNLQAHPELATIEETATELKIGAATTFGKIHQHPVVAREFPLLHQAALSVGAVAIQNRATIGGNIANASPAADSPPVLLAYDSRIELQSASGSRVIPYSSFHTGYKTMQLAPDEIIRALILPRTSATETVHGYFRKVGPRKAQAITKVSLAGLLRLSPDGTVSDVRLAFGSVAPVPLRCIHTEAIVRGQKLTDSVISRAKSSLLTEVTPIDDIRSTAEYRMTVATHLLEEFLRTAPGTS